MATDRSATPESVAVVIPTFDRKEWVQRAIESVLAQTRPADEIVVVDDGSTDGTADGLAGAGLPITLLRQERQGVSAARNRGIETSTSRWIAFLDSDDEWRPGKLERQMTALQAEPEYRICHTEETWIRNGNQVLPRRVHKKRGGWIFHHCLARCAISPSSVLVDREVFERLGLFDESLPACEDYDLWLRVCSRYPVLLVDEPLVIKHGGHADQLSRRFPAMDRFRIQALEKAVADPDLAADHRAAAIAQLTEKLRVYVEGAAKRGRANQVAAERARLDELISLHPRKTTER